MAANYVLLEKITVGAAGASSVTFSGIPQTGYTDLVIKISARSANASNFDNPRLTINGSTSTFSRRELYAESGSVGSENVADRLIGVVPAANATSSTFGSLDFYLPNYTSANYKSYSVDSVTENNSSTQAMWLLAGLWSTTSAITDIAISLQSAGSFAQYSTFYLYGVAKLGTTPAIVPYATGGDTIMTDGTYWYHAFLSSGTFTPQKGLSCDVLTIAGGGGGGSGDGANQGAGGGGAGGVMYQTSRSVSNATTVTIGGGGNGGTWASGNGNNGSTGSNSVFDTLTGNGGGYGATVPAAGGNGGSGGGAGAGLSASGGTASAGSGGGTGYANAGGANTGFTGAGGGGGGSGAAGSVAASNIGGAGGAGLNTWSSWASATSTGVSGFYAGGGGGAGYSTLGNGAAGSGGATAGANGSASNATANTGSGGGGSSGTSARSGGNGGSGLVIVRYLV
jgi:hypothetical protein